MGDDILTTEGMTPSEIVEAATSGRLDDYLQAPNRPPRGDEAPTRGKRPEEIQRMLDEGELDAYMRRRR